MGIINNATSDILVDAVFTDKGRQAMAKNDGSFSIVKFAVADDEVDYLIIKEYGRTVGKEKIEKNTGVFEALTNENLALKYRCVSISNQNLIRLPSLSLTGTGVNSTTRVISMGTSSTRRVTVTVEQSISNETVIDVELRDQAFLVEMNNLFLQVPGRTPTAISFQQKATYFLEKNAGETSKGGSTLTLSLETKSITDSSFTIYGQQFNKNLISTIVRITGLTSGAVLEYEVQITKNA